MKKSPAQPGVIFDWDGVLVDTVHAHTRSWEILAAEHNFLLPENHSRLGFGKCNEEIISRVLGWSNNPEEIKKLSGLKEDIFKKIISEEGLEPLPGVRRLLEDLRQRKIPCALVSSSPRANIDLALEIMDLQPLFSGIVTVECVHSEKSPQDAFMRATCVIERLPENCVIFEDSLSGIKAGIESGFKVVAVATTNPPELLRRTPAHCVVNRLTEVGVGLIDVLLRERK